MRLSVGSCPLALRAAIVFNGKIIKYCFEADDERGYVDVYIHPFIVHGDRILAHRLFGKVRIIDPLAVDLAEIYLR